MRSRGKQDNHRPLAWSRRATTPDLILERLAI
jgi:hypothetical protein